MIGRSVIELSFAVNHVAAPPDDAVVVNAEVRYCGSGGVVV